MILFFSAEGITILELFTNVSFDPTVFDEVRWQPIDETVITDIHQMHQILPCAFPHMDYYRANNIKPPTLVENTNESEKETRNLKLKKINPEDDSITTLQRIRSKGNKFKKQMFTHQKKRTTEKRQRYRERKKVLNDAVNKEIKDFEEAKQDLEDTMDVFITPGGSNLLQHKPTTRKRQSSINEISPTLDQSMVTRSGRVVKARKL